MDDFGRLAMKDPATENSRSIPTHTLLQYHDGFSFGVENEVNAYRAAYVYRFCKETRVTHNHNGWRVSVWR